MSRLCWDRTFAPKAAILSGPARTLLPFHARERMRRFFFFAYSVKLSCDYLQRVHGVRLVPRDAVARDATHQIAKGHRIAGGTPFDKSKPLSNTPLTWFGAMDAAHVNNLGLTQPFCTLMGGLRHQDPMLDKLWSYCVAGCAATILLPQAVNLGPDRCVDRVHSELIGTVFPQAGPTSPIVSAPHADLYIVQANTALIDYAQDRRKEGAPALSDMADLYRQGIAACQPILISDASRDLEALLQELNEHLREHHSKVELFTGSDYHS